MLGQVFILKVQSGKFRLGTSTFLGKNLSLIIGILHYGLGRFQGQGDHKSLMAIWALVIEIKSISVY